LALEIRKDEEGEADPKLLKSAFFGSLSDYSIFYDLEECLYE
jgi:hypothetical protein